MERTNHALATILEAMTPGSPVSRGALRLYPLSSEKDGGARDFDLLEDALRAGTLDVEEMSDSGSVPELRVINSGSNSVLILEGDELIGLKQNRAVNSSVLVGAGTGILLPVSCVERGRWSRSSQLSRSTSSSHLALRRLKSDSVHASLRARKGHRSDQRAVWAEVERKSARHGSVSETAALHDTRLSLERDLEGFRSLSENLPKDTRGVVVAIGGKPVALELLPDARTFSKTARRLISGYALEALEHEPNAGGGTASGFVSVRDFVRRVSAVVPEEHPAVGEGRDLRLAGEGLSGYALVDGEAVLHAAAFA